METTPPKPSGTVAPSTLKHKRFTVEEQEFIRHHSVDLGWTEEQIAKEMGVSAESIRGTKAKLKLQAKIEGEEVIAGPAKKLTPEQRRLALKGTFKLSRRYKRMSSQLNKEDIDNFTDMWVDYAMQFDDMKPSEEDIVELIITFKLRLDDNRREYKAVQDQEEVLRQKLGSKGDAELDLENEEDRFLYEMTTSNNRKKQELNKDFKELTTKLNEYFEAMNATREQREAQQTVGGDTFLSLVRQLNDAERRESVGLYNERMKLATESKKKFFKGDHKLLSGEVRPILLDGADYNKDTSPLKAEDVQHIKDKEISKENNEYTAS